MLNQKLQQKLSQKLSPQQIQLMKLLQIPTANLEQRIEEELEANPALEEGNELKEEDPYGNENEQEKEEERTDEDFDISDYIDDDDTPDYRTRSNNSSPDDEQKTIPVAVSQTFHEHLQRQVGLQDLDPKEHDIAMQLVGSIDEDGYLRRDLESIVDDLAFTQNVMTSVEELEEMLEVVQKFDPPGVGARSLQECLLLQLEKDEEPTEEQELAIKILKEQFETFTKKHYEKMQRSLGVSDEELKDAIDEILKLNPKPGSMFASQSKIHTYIVPDYILENQDGELSLKLNSRNAPELRVSDSFQEMLKGYSASKEKDKKQKEAIMFIKQKIDSAKWFIDAIRQRQATMINVMQAILERQYQYFLTGDETELRPMILKDIAEVTDLDISTVSRVANSKYVQTEFGTFLLKSFFSESLSTESGEEVSTREVKKILSDLIEGESKKKPLSDQKLTDLLKEKGYNIARRTVAKYREQLNIPVARLRKEL